VKVLLIYPPKFREITTNVPAVVEEGSGCYPPLGLLSIAAVLRAGGGGHTVEVLDTQALGLDYAQIEAEVRRRAPDVVGIQVMTFTLLDAMETARAAKRARPGVHLTMGGPHAHLYPAETVAQPEVDTVVVGEGEYVFRDLVAALAEGRGPQEIEGVVWKRDDGTPVVSPARPHIKDLDELPFPARDLVPTEKYYSSLARSRPVTTMISSRGCPHRCVFCDRPHLGKTYRARSPERMVEEMAECVERFGVREIFFYDDTFAIERQRMLAVCDAILERGLKVAWDIRARVDTMDEEVLRRLRAAGCARIHYGVEAGTPEILKVLRKGITLERALEVFRLTRKVGITTLAYFMLGNPGETREQMAETLRFARKLDPDYIHLSLTTPFPGTELYRMGLEQGLFKSDYWREFARDPRPDFVPELWTEVLSRDELAGLLREGYKSFYRRPGYLLRRLLEVRSLGELWRKARVGLKILLGK